MEPSCGELQGLPQAGTEAPEPLVRPANLSRGTATAAELASVSIVGLRDGGIGQTQSKRHLSEEVRQHAKRLLAAGEQQQLTRLDLERREAALEERRLEVEDTWQRQRLSAAVGLEAAIEARGARLAEVRARIADAEQRAVEETRSRRSFLERLQAAAHECAEATWHVEQDFARLSVALNRATGMLRAIEKDIGHLRLEAFQVEQQHQDLEVRELSLHCMGAAWEKAIAQCRHFSRDDVASPDRIMHHATECIVAGLLKSDAYIGRLRECVEVVLSQPEPSDTAWLDSERVSAASTEDGAGLELGCLDGAESPRTPPWGSASESAQAGVLCEVAAGSHVEVQEEPVDWCAQPAAVSERGRPASAPPGTPQRHAATAPGPSAKAMPTQSLSPGGPMPGTASTDTSGGAATAGGTVPGAVHRMQSMKVLPCAWQCAPASAAFPVPAAPVAPAAPAASQAASTVLLSPFLVTCAPTSAAVLRPTWHRSQQHATGGLHPPPLACTSSTPRLVVAGANTSAVTLVPTAVPHRAPTSVGAAAWASQAQPSLMGPTDGSVWQA